MCDSGLYQPEVMWLYHGARPMCRRRNNFLRCLLFVGLFCDIHNVRAAAWLSSFSQHGSIRKRSTCLSSAWSNCAEMLESASDDQNVTIDLKDCHGMTGASSRGRPLDLSSPREWLEYWEDQCGQRPGAYTVMRCDYQCCSETENPWIIWGQDFHLNRLSYSWRYLVGMDSVSSDKMENLKLKSKMIIEQLLSGADTIITKQSSDDKSFQKGTVVTVMLTLLWQRPRGVQDNSFGTKASEPLIKGHICSFGVPAQILRYDPEPASVALALQRPDGPWPGRIENYPKAKLSSWCRQRRPIEEYLKKEGIGEVLLVKAGKKESDSEILEGLVSNAFFVYPEGILRTSGQDVLEGYARHLVLEFAEQCGLTVDTSQPVSIQDSNQWEEVFMTSSIRLITPVREIVLPRYSAGSSEISSFEHIWSRTISLKGDNRDPYWRQIYTHMLSDQYISECGNRGIRSIMDMVSNIWASQ